MHGECCAHPEGNSQSPAWANRAQGPCKTCLSLPRSYLESTSFAQFIPDFAIRHRYLHNSHYTCIGQPFPPPRVLTAQIDLSNLAHLHNISTDRHLRCPHLHSLSLSVGPERRAVCMAHSLFIFSSDSVWFILPSNWQRLQQILVSTLHNLFPQRDKLETHSCLAHTQIPTILHLFRVQCLHLHPCLSSASFTTFG